MEQHQGFLGTASHPNLLPGSLMISALAFVFWVTETMFYLLNLSLNMTMQFTGFHLVPRIPVKHKVCKKSLPNKSWQ